MKVGVIVFGAALVLALISGVLAALDVNPQILGFLMILLGIAAGYYNITKEEKLEFMVAGIAFILASQVVLQVSSFLTSFSFALFSFLATSLLSLMLFSAGALLYIAIKSVIDLIRD